MKVNNTSSLKKIFFFILTILIVSCNNDKELFDNDEKTWQIASCEFIDSVASDFAVDYSIFSKFDNIFIAYYDKNHQLSLAMRDLNKNWSYNKLNEFVDWDEHKSTKILVDKDGYIHVFANMHCSPLTYYKSDKPYSIASFSKCSMTGSDENYCTYPDFLISEDKILFHYRSGMSGKGIEIFNIYDYNTGQWSRFLDQPLFDGLGQCSSYFYGPILDSSGRFHMVWCWRTNGDCSTNWGVFYSYSDDLKTWKSLSGESSNIPIKPSDDIYLVDNVPEKGGLLNGCIVLGFNNENKPIIIYHKYDKNGNTNIFCALTNEMLNKWEVKQITDWTWRWDFSGEGSIIYELYFHDVWKVNDNIYCVYFRNQSSAKLLKYDIDTTDHFISEYSEYPEIINEKLDPNLDIIHVIFDSSKMIYGDRQYLIRYETINPNRGIQTDRDCTPSKLMLYSIRNK